MQRSKMKGLNQVAENEAQPMKAQGVLATWGLREASGASENCNVIHALRNPIWMRPSSSFDY